MKTPIKIAAIFATLLLISCSASEKDWHENVRKMGAKSVFVRKDGTKTTGEEWYKNHPDEDKKFKEKYGETTSGKNHVNPSQVFIGME